MVEEIGAGMDREWNIRWELGVRRGNSDEEEHFKQEKSEREEEFRR